MRKAKIAGVLILIGSVLYWLQRDPIVQPSDVPKLAIDESAKVVIKKNSVLVVSKDKNGNDKVVSKYVPFRATVTVKKDGTVQVVVKEKGLTFQPGISCIYTERKFLLGLDTQWAYWKRLSLHSGTGLDFSEANRKRGLNGIVASLFNPYVAIGYSLPFERLSNTDIIMGYGFSSKEIVVGASLRF